MDVEHENNNNEQTENLEELPDSQLKEGWFSQHSKAINAFTAIGSFVTTTVLALFAYLSWTEVQLQRDLAFKQFVVANAPSVRTYATKGFKFEENVGWMTWNAVNQGGPVNDVIYKTIIFCCGAEEIKNPNTTKIIVRSALRDKLRRNENTTIKVLTTEKEILDWLKPFIEGKKYGLYLYVSASFTIPPELSLSGKESKDRTYSLHSWEPYKNSFEGVKPEYERIFLKILNEREYLAIEHKG
jgi:hypothetical protein